MNKKTARTFRLDQDVVDKILKLQAFYSAKLNVTHSQADVIKTLVNNEYQSIDKNQLDQLSK